ncbi:hypothetical protein B0H14DRAFT_2638532 [Mycena olivaceomarginata]|nr:hypothetical protein B0H14DRAFT_2638532 [Mycena olivaceomarginata]
MEDDGVSGVARANSSRLHFETLKYFGTGTAVLVVAIERIGDMDARAEAEADVAIEWIGMRAGEMEANENSEVSAVDGRPLPVRDISMKSDGIVSRTTPGKAILPFRGHRSLFNGLNAWIVAADLGRIAYLTHLSQTESDGVTPKEKYLEGRDLGGWCCRVAVKSGFCQRIANPEFDAPRVQFGGSVGPRLRFVGFRTSAPPQNFSHPGLVFLGTPLVRSYQGCIFYYMKGRFKFRAEQRPLDGPNSGIIQLLSILDG